MEQIENQSFSNSTEWYNIFEAENLFNKIDRSNLIPTTYELKIIPQKKNKIKYLNHLFLEGKWSTTTVLVHFHRIETTTTGSKKSRNLKRPK